ncbi:MAG: hypothetical protein HW421_2528 [Ignavibacteria bacterium]|nr:hypothetical protein [Ignavibacteria bacterium]
MWWWCKGIIFLSLKINKRFLMKEIFLERAKENIKAAELLFENGLFNA